MNDVFRSNQYHAPSRCGKCGGSMEYKGVGEYRCESCGNVEYDDYGTVRNYIEEHRGATVVEIASATGINQSIITRMLREERLEVASESRVFLKCVSCGRDITSGKFCPLCAKLAEAAAKKRERESRKHNYVGFENEAGKGQSGAKRFRRGDDR